MIFYFVLTQKTMDSKDPESGHTAVAVVIPLVDIKIGKRTSRYWLMLIT